MNDTYYMKTALALAEKGLGMTSPNPMVGAVVVKNDEIVGRGYHHACGHPHAEVEAIRDAGSAARGADIYVTLEPCNHHGKTPPCTELIISAGIKRVVYAMDDPNPKASGGGEYLEKNGIQTLSGVLKKEAQKLNEAFLKSIVKNLPFVTIKIAATLDGRTATKTGHSKWITNPASRGCVHLLRHANDAILTGIGTIIADDPSMTARPAGFAGKDPKRIILDSNLSIPVDSKILKLDSDAETVIITGSRPDCDETGGETTDAEASRKKMVLKEKGARVIETELKQGRINFKGLMEILGREGISSVLIEAGSKVSYSAVKSGVVDKAVFFYAPKVLAADDGYPMFRGSGPEAMDLALDLKDVKTKMIDGDIMVEGYL